MRHQRTLSTASSDEDDYISEGRENTGRWTSAEHAMFLEGLRIHGKGWKQIAQMIRTRSVVQIRTHAQKYFQKLAKAQQSAGGAGAFVGEVFMDTRPTASSSGIIDNARSSSASSTASAAPQHHQLPFGGSNVPGSASAGGVEGTRAGHGGPVGDPARVIGSAAGSVVLAQQQQLELHAATQYDGSGSGLELGSGGLLAAAQPARRTKASARKKARDAAAAAQAAHAASVAADRAAAAPARQRKRKMSSADGSPAAAGGGALAASYGGEAGLLPPSPGRSPRSPRAGGGQRGRKKKFRAPDPPPDPPPPPPLTLHIDAALTHHQQQHPHHHGSFGGGGGEFDGGAFILPGDGGEEEDDGNLDSPSPSSVADQYMLSTFEMTAQLRGVGAPGAGKGFMLPQRRLEQQKQQEEEQQARAHAQRAQHSIAVSESHWVGSNDTNRHGGGGGGNSAAAMGDADVDALFVGLDEVGAQDLAGWFCATGAEAGAGSSSSGQTGEEGGGGGGASDQLLYGDTGREVDDDGTNSSHSSSTGASSNSGSEQDLPPPFAAISSNQATMTRSFDEVEAGNGAQASNLSSSYHAFPTNHHHQQEQQSKLQQQQQQQLQLLSKKAFTAAMGGNTSHPFALHFQAQQQQPQLAPIAPSTSATTSAPALLPSASSGRGSASSVLPLQPQLQGAFPRSRGSSFDSKAGAGRPLLLPAPAAVGSASSSSSEAQAVLKAVATSIGGPAGVVGGGLDPLLDDEVTFDDDALNFFVAETGVDGTGAF